MSIWEAFGKGRYKGFSREAGLLLDEAVELAGGLGCKKADTGHPVSYTHLTLPTIRLV